MMTCEGAHDAVRTQGHGEIEKAGEIRRPFVLLCTTSKHYLRFLAAFFAPPRFLLADLRPDFFVADFFFLVAMIHSPLTGVKRPDRSPGGSVGRYDANEPSYLYTASERLVKLKSFTLMVGITISPPCSVPASRTDGPSISRLFSMNNGDSLKRKLRTAFVTLPFSIRNVPSRVSPV